MIFESFKISISDTKTEAFHKPFYLLLNLAVGGLWPGYEIDNSVFPLEIVYKYLEKHLIFYDDFNGEELDRTKWDYDIGTGTNGWELIKSSIIPKKKIIYFYQILIYILEPKKKNIKILNILQEE